MALDIFPFHCLQWYKHEEPMKTHKIAWYRTFGPCGWCRTSVKSTRAIAVGEEGADFDFFSIALYDDATPAALLPEKHIFEFEFPAFFSNIPFISLYFCNNINSLQCFSSFPARYYSLNLSKNSHAFFSLATCVSYSPPLYASPAILCMRWLARKLVPALWVRRRFSRRRGQARRPS